MSSNINRSKIRKMILKEFKMMGMANMGTVGTAPMGVSSHSFDGGMHDMMGSEVPGMDVEFDMGDDMHTMQTHDHSQGGVSKEDCCAAVMSLIECCACPDTKSALMQCCQDILAGRI